jgi:MoaA/NifB/PqqE/SkfB family radical SAM enzyme
VKWVQFIGGEPTLHPDFRRLVISARQLGLEVEVYTNLTRVSSDLWRLFDDEKVALATSFYSCHEVSHDTVTRTRGSQKRTLANIETAVKLELPLRVGIIDVRVDQDIERTVDYLHDLGVSNVQVDRTRSVGRADSQQFKNPSVDQLCGRCADSSLAIDPSGWAYPCIFARWLPVGNVRDTALEEICSSPLLAKTREDLTTSFESRVLGDERLCGPGTCNPNCDPSLCGPRCAPNQCLPGGVQEEEIEEEREEEGEDETEEEREEENRANA